MKRLLLVLGLLLLLLLVYRLKLTRSEAGPPTPETGPPVAVESAAPPVPGSMPGSAESETAALDPEAGPAKEYGAGREGQVPEELLGTGDATLRVWLLDEATGAPVAAPVTLWRLGVPEGQGWKGGDQIQRTFRVSLEGEVVLNLPVGRYRLQCDEQRAGAADPAEFTIASGENVRHITVLLPREFRAMLRVYDLQGREIREGILESARTGYCSRESYRAPEWADPRKPLIGQGFSGFGGRGDSRPTGWSPRPSNLAGHDGFDLGLHEEAWRLKFKGGLHQFRLPGHCDIRAAVSSHLAREATLVGLLVPMETVLECVRLPEGEELTLADAEVTAYGFAELFEGGDPFETAKQTRIHVQVKLPGYKRLNYEWKSGEIPGPQVFSRAE